MSILLNLFNFVLEQNNNAAMPAAHVRLCLQQDSLCSSDRCVVRLTGHRCLPRPLRIVAKSFSLGSCWPLPDLHGKQEPIS